MCLDHLWGKGYNFLLLGRLQDFQNHQWIIGITTKPTRPIESIINRSTLSGSIGTSYRKSIDLRPSTGLQVQRIRGGNAGECKWIEWKCSDDRHDRACNHLSIERRGWWIIAWHPGPSISVTLEVAEGDLRNKDTRLWFPRSVQTQTSGFPYVYSCFLWPIMESFFLQTTCRSFKSGRFVLSSYELHILFHIFMFLMKLHVLVRSLIITSTIGEG